MKILLASPRGFCAGVDRAISIVEQALQKFGTPIYVRHEIVHNKIVVDRLREKGAIFVEELEEVPQNAVVIFSAHGVSQAVVSQADSRKLVPIDATCPLVKRVHALVQKHDEEQRDIILIGHKGHPEVEGTMGQLPDGKVHLVGSVEDVYSLHHLNEENLAYTTQTTLSIDETKEIIHALHVKYPKISGPEQGDLCYATTNRQKAVKAMIDKVDLFLVVGSSNSSNSNRLKEIGRTNHVLSYLIDGPQDLRLEWFHDVEVVGISSGASAPEDLVQDVVAWIQREFPSTEVEDYILLKENVQFKLPKELREV